MGFTINNEQWTPQTINEHAEAWIDQINELLAQNNVKDEDGNVIKLEKNFANAVYLQVLAGSQRLQLNDEKLQAALNSFNIEACDDQQIENLLPIAAIERDPGSYSTLVLTVKATEDGVCTIPAGTLAPFGDVNFVVQTDVILQPGATQNINTVCDTIGAVVVLAGEIDSFKTQITNLESVTNPVSSVPGNNAETIESIRQRIIKGETIPYSIEGVKIALENLTGINSARVFFNFNITTPITLTGGVVLAPRTAYIVINGDSEQIAKTYAKYMSAPTQNSQGASPTGTPTTVDVDIVAGNSDVEILATTSFIYNGVTFVADEAQTITAGQTTAVGFTSTTPGAVIIPAGTDISFIEPPENIRSATAEASVPGIPKTAYSQDYITSSGQAIPIKYDKAEDETVYVKIVLEKDAEVGSQVTNQLKRDLITASASWVIGENVTTLLTDKAFSECTYTTVAYTLVSTDGETWSDRIETPVNAIPKVSDSTIIVTSVEDE